MRYGIRVGVEPEMMVAFLNNPLHVRALGSNNAPRHLKLVFIHNLDVVPASKLDILLLLKQLVHLLLIAIAHSFFTNAILAHIQGGILELRI